MRMRILYRKLRVPVFGVARVEGASRRRANNCRGKVIDFYLLRYADV